MLTAILAYLVLVLATSAISFAAYGIDKKRAGTSIRRIPERTFHTLALLGGWPGALCGQRYYRHKTQKTPFLIVFWALVVLHITLVIYLFSLLGSSVGDSPPGSSPGVEAF